MPRSSKWSVPIRFSYQSPVYISSFPDTCYMPSPSHMSCSGLSPAAPLYLHFLNSPGCKAESWTVQNVHVLYFTSIWHYDLEHKHGDCARTHTHHTNTHAPHAHCAHAHTYTHTTHTHLSQEFIIWMALYIKCLLIWHTVCWLTEQRLTELHYCVLWHTVRQITQHCCKQYNKQHNV